MRDDGVPDYGETVSDIVDALLEYHRLWEHDELPDGEDPKQGIGFLLGMLFRAVNADPVPAERDELETQLEEWFQEHDDLGKGEFLRCPRCGGGVVGRWRSAPRQVTCKTACADCGVSKDIRVFPDWRGLNDYPKKKVPATRSPSDGAGPGAHELDSIIEDEYYRDYKQSIGEEEE